MNEIKCGFADEIITPENPKEIYLDGYGFRLHPADRVRDDLHAKACAFSDGENVFLLLSLDLIGLRGRSYQIIIDQITAITGVPKENIAINCIHTHSAPAMGLLDELPVNYDYLAFVGDRAGIACKKAIDRLSKGTFRFEILKETLSHVHNRRGRTDIDKSIRTMVFCDENGKKKGVLCSSACHAVIGSEFFITADWLSELNKISSDDMPYMFLQGRGADINPYFENKSSMEEEIIALGKELSIPVKKNAEKDVMGEKIFGKINSCYEEVKIPMRKYDDLSRIKKIEQKELKHYFDFEDPIDKHCAFRELQWARKMIKNVEGGKETDITVPLSMMSVAKKFIFLFIPFELLTITGNKLEDVCVKAGFKKESVYVCGYTNVIEGYLAPEEEYNYTYADGDGSRYEVEDAAHWYGNPEFSPESEKAVLFWFKNKIGKLI